MTRQAILILIFLFCVNSLEAESFVCGNYVGTCRGSSSGNSCADTGKTVNGKKEVYCPYFQCDSSGNVKMNESHKVWRPPNILGSIRNIGIIRSDSYTCYANCCYTGGGFIGQINSDPGCRNLCCEKLDDYLRGSCGGGEPPAAPPSINPPPAPPGVEPPSGSPPDEDPPGIVF